MGPADDIAGMTGLDPFEAFVRRYQDMVFATAVRLLGNPADAEDVAQTVFLRAFERFDTIGPSPGAAGWLKTVTTNACLNHLSRYRARWRFFSELGRADAADIDDAGLGRPFAGGGDGAGTTNASNWSARSGCCPITSGCRSSCSTSRTRAIRTSPPRWAFRWAR